jgi:PAS domain S-box-containing protein
VHPSDVDGLILVTEAALRSPQSEVTFEVRVRFADGQWHWIRETVSLRGDSPDEARIVIRAHEMAVLHDAEPPVPSRAFRSALGAMLDPFVIFRAVRSRDHCISDFVCEYANEAASRALGLSEGELRLKLLFGPRGVEGTSPLFPLLVRAVESKRPFAADSMPGDDVIGDIPVVGTFDVRITPLSDAVALTWRDVTERELTNARLQIQARFLEEIDAAVVASDAELRITYWSPGAEHLYGWPGEDVIGRTVSDVLMPSLTHAEAMHMAELSMSELHAANEYAVLDRAGKSKHVLVRTVPLFDGDEKSGLLGISVDISERKEVEDELRQTSDELRAITDSMAEGLYTVDGAGRFSFVNDAAVRLLGWEKDTLLGRSAHETMHSTRDGDSLPAADCAILGALESGQVVSVEVDYFRRRDGSSVAVSYTAAPLGPAASRGAVVVFQDVTERVAEEERLQRELEKLSWVGRIRDAMDEDRFVLFAQPIVELATATTVQHELLLRMVDSHGRIVEPGRFLPTAEECGATDQIDCWVVRQSVQLAARGFPVEFNISARSVGNGQIRRTLREAIAEFGADPRDLVCEITETALIHDMHGAEEFVRSLRDIGCRVALDDFGAGYGGFGYLKRLPVSYLKIDMQFVQDLASEESSRHVIEAIVGLARGFRLETIAEGAEDEATVQILSEIGVDHVQGFAVARPLPIFEAFPGLGKLERSSGLRSVPGLGER